MENIMHQTIPVTYTAENTHQSAFSLFINWCSGQEHNRFGWLGAALASHGCVFTPITMFAIILSGNNMFFWSLALVAMGMALVTNLAAMPTKITIPVFFLSILIDLGVIISCAFIGFQNAGSYI